MDDLEKQITDLETELAAFKRLTLAMAAAIFETDQAKADIVRGYVLLSATSLRRAGNDAVANRVEGLVEGVLPPAEE